MWTNLLRLNQRVVASVCASSNVKRIVPLTGGFVLGALLTSNSVLGDSSELLEKDTNENNNKLVLYQYWTCPFCCKVRTFLEYYNFDYDIVEVNPLFRNEIKFSDYRKVPIVKYGDTQINDSSLIISAIKSHLINRENMDTILKYYPILESTNEKGKPVKEFQNKYRIMYLEGKSNDENKKIREEVKWRKWVDDVFVHTLSPNIYRTMPESLQALEYITHVGNFQPYERTLVYYAGALSMYVVGKIVKRRHHLKDDVRQSMYEEATKWTRAVGKKKYLGGEQPNLADLNMFGVIRAIEGLDAFEDLMQNTKLESWYGRMDNQVKKHAGETMLKIKNQSSL